MKARATGGWCATNGLVLNQNSRPDPGTENNSSHLVKAFEFLQETSAEYRPGRDDVSDDPVN